jgi:regulator of replication initiation timing
MNKRAIILLSLTLGCFDTLNAEPTPKVIESYSSKIQILKTKLGTIGHGFKDNKAVILKKKEQKKAQAVYDATIQRHVAKTPEGKKLFKKISKVEKNIKKLQKQLAQLNKKKYKLKVAVMNDRSLQSKPDVKKAREDLGLKQQECSEQINKLIAGTAEGAKLQKQLKKLRDEYMALWK